MMPSLNNVKMKVTLTTEDKDGTIKHTTHEVTLTMAEQRALVEANYGEPCFRMWVGNDEINSIGAPDWCTYQLKDGRWSIWRKESDVRALMAIGNDEALSIVSAINQRRLGDDA